LVALAFTVPRMFIMDIIELNSGQVGSVKFFCSFQKFSVMLLFKALFFIRFILVPVYLHGWSSLFFLFISSAITAYYLEILFLVNHNQAGLIPSTTDHWAMKSCLATSNWSSGSLFWNWFSGGLNHQIEHHLFPSLNHYLLPYISPVVLEVCKEYNLPYYNFKDFSTAFDAMCQHLTILGYEETDPKRPTLSPCPDLQKRAGGVKEN